MKKTITMKTDKLKEKILSKFGSINAFANHRKQDLNSWIIVRTLNGTRKKNFETVLKEIEQKVENLRPEKEIQNETRNFIRRTIFNEFGSFAEFNRKFPRFSTTFLSNISTGKKKIFDDKSRDLLNVVFFIHTRKEKT